MILGKKIAKKPKKIPAPRSRKKPPSPVETGHIVVDDADIAVIRDALPLTMRDGFVALADKSPTTSGGRRMIGVECIRIENGRLHRTPIDRCRILSVFSYPLVCDESKTPKRPRIQLCMINGQTCIVGMGYDFLVVGKVPSSGGARLLGDSYSSLVEELRINTHGRFRISQDEDLGAYLMALSGDTNKRGVCVVENAVIDESVPTRRDAGGHRVVAFKYRPSDGIRKRPDSSVLCATDSVVRGPVSTWLDNRAPESSADVARRIHDAWLIQLQARIARSETSVAELVLQMKKERRALEGYYQELARGLPYGDAWLDAWQDACAIPGIAHAERNGGVVSFTTEQFWHQETADRKIFLGEFHVKILADGGVAATNLRAVTGKAMHVSCSRTYGACTGIVMPCLGSHDALLQSAIDGRDLGALVAVVVQFLRDPAVGDSRADGNRRDAPTRLPNGHAVTMRICRSAWQLDAASEERTFYLSGGTMLAQSSYRDAAGIAGHVTYLPDEEDILDDDDEEIPMRRGRTHRMRRVEDDNDD